MTPLLYAIFALSGAAGLIYESIWTRYLGLLVGHDAYAQILVLVIFLGGMSLGAMVVSRWSERVAQPLHGYVAIEFVTGCIGLFFQEVFQAAQNWAYGSVFPALTDSHALTAAKWGVAGLLILPQSVLLGMTFPLMSAGVLRIIRTSPGRTLSLLYFTNSLGAAVGVLVAGFYLVDVAGLPGTLAAAASLNLVAAAGTMIVVGVRGKPAERAGGAGGAGGAAEVVSGAAGDLPRLLLFASFATAVASFIYEIAWNRMLALVLGSATHSFELMLSAFILGLALGAWWIQSRADRLRNALRTLGLVQWTMGALALATLPLYVRSFGWVASMLGTFAPTDAGYAGFNLGRYSLCLAIMLPATFCAGMTLPLLTRTLMVHGAGERAVGAVYGWNTLGSIAGAAGAGLVLLPALGLHALLIAGAVVDMAVGVLLLRRASGSGRFARWLAPAAAAATLLAVVVSWGGVRLDRVLLSSGVYRTGRVQLPGEREIRFYRDGRTASVTAGAVRETGQLFLATNGKTDASLTPEWLMSCDSTVPRVPLALDAATQTMLPLITLSYAPKARTAAVIGFGSGMSSHLLLASPALRNLVTVEIEPQMIAGARIFYPANRRAYEDPRSHIMIDDAKSYFASTARRYDLIMSEPSNPWVSGVSGLFTEEFYGRVRQYLSDDGVFGQWLHLYELDDELVLSVLGALHRNFRSYEIYLVASNDLLIVASNQKRLPEPDWSVIDLPAIRRDLCHFRPLDVEALEALHLAGRRELGPLLGSIPLPNSDYFPTLDLGAERRRFRRDVATGFPALSLEWFGLLSAMRDHRVAPSARTVAAVPENPRARARAIGALLRSRAAVEPVADTAVPPGGAQAVFQWRQWSEGVGHRPTDWVLWADQVHQMERLRNDGTAGVADTPFYGEVRRTLEQFQAPRAVRDLVAFRESLATWNFGAAAEAADRLLPVAMADHRWITADELRDGAVFAKLRSGDVQGARAVLDRLARFSVRGPGDLRNQLLAAYVRSAEFQRAMGLSRPKSLTER